jgi:hypothetical protein
MRKRSLKFLAGRLPRLLRKNRRFLNLPKTKRKTYGGRSRLLLRNSLLLRMQHKALRPNLLYLKWTDA